PRLAFDFIDGGADAEITLRRNVEAFERHALRPRQLVGVALRSQETTVLGERVAMPVLVAPTGMSRVAGRGGDVAGARAAARMGTVFTLSTMSSDSIEEVAKRAAGALWFQLYLWRQRDMAERLVARAQAAGYRALVVTADVPVVGNRVRDLHNGFKFPPRIALGTAVDMLRHPRWLAQMPSAMAFENIAEATGGARSGAMEHAKLVNSLLANPGATWEDLRWLRELWEGPLVLKGVLTREDAEAAADVGVDGVIVSNHGGRQLDGTLGTLDALEEVVGAVGDRVEVLVDGGVRRGTDVVKALALGARACLVGRPWLYGLAVGGEQGVVDVLDILRAEIDRALALLGRPSLSDLDGSALSPRASAARPG
ncbi:MAG: L-lactate dehydrogenase, partial [Solirubrobacterales bacterium]|nr:L-lactate dehydrogenase [Solirubrobacterales bacterium]